MKQIILSLLVFFSTNRLLAQNGDNSIENALRSVVTIALYNLESDNTVFGYGEDREAAKAYEQALDLSGSVSSGSGFVIEYKGQFYIVTNAHVIDGAAAGSESVGVFSIARKKYPVRLVGGDSFYDIAVLAFEDLIGGDEFLPLPFAAESPRLTEKVFAVGNPLGKYPYTITDGIVSGKNRLFQKTTTGKYGYLQHTATLIWGNSGGPLVNQFGELVGVNTWIGTKAKDNQQFIFSQLNFAIEADLVKNLVTEIIENEGRVRRNYLGVEFAVRKDLYGQDSPPFINNALENSPAFEYLKDKKGFYVKEINEEPIRTLQDILRVMETGNPKDSITLVIQKEEPSSSGASLKLGFKKTETVLIPGGELSIDELENIAQYFFETYSDYQLASEKGQIQLRKKDDKPSPKIERILVEEAQTSFTVSKGNDQYQIVGSGLLDKWGRGTLYRIRTLKDIGAVIRLCSLEGHLSASVTDEIGSVENVRLFVQDEDFEELKVLYY